MSNLDPCPGPVPNIVREYKKSKTEKLPPTLIAKYLLQMQTQK
ncbi:predicted protein [Sclerotinia sclerotiorum 1980 UF-70]|uniref:Uncharacterized protein n=1 Tax=Sclerotinia sclerotiorum (strain ATCC 18683 / 1980 / Ss-1) TaxID=665079 RepID=A7E5K6_SCLS1|nr:predicted protein [Sclerotinia sclerotiorum 1980 UF-70]EDN91178.1 predicted protein [Sclerotinia sclerotiorum 1980 UF-70]